MHVFCVLQTWFQNKRSRSRRSAVSSLSDVSDMPSSHQVSPSSASTRGPQRSRLSAVSSQSDVSDMPSSHQVLRLPASTRGPGCYQLAKKRSSPLPAVPAGQAIYTSIPTPLSTTMQYYMALHFTPETELSPILPLTAAARPDMLSPIISSLYSKTFDFPTTYPPLTSWPPPAHQAIFHSLPNTSAEVPLNLSCKVAPHASSHIHQVAPQVSDVPLNLSTGSNLNGSTASSDTSVFTDSSDYPSVFIGSSTSTRTCSESSDEATLNVWD